MKTQGKIQFSFTILLITCLILIFTNCTSDRRSGKDLSEFQLALQSWDTVSFPYDTEYELSVIGSLKTISDTIKSYLQEINRDYMSLYKIGKF